MKISEQSFLPRMLPWVGLVTTLVVTPWTTFDPINLPKLTAITIGGFISLAIAATHMKTIFKASFRIPILIVIVFIFDLVLVLFFAGNNFNQEFYGTFGRSTGFLAYVSLAGLFIGGIFSASKYLLRRLSWFLLISGMISMVYGAMQFIGADPVNWANPYSPVIGFLGNPNFQSSFLGFSGIVAFAFLICETATRIRVGLIVLLFLTTLVIYGTKSQQGFMILFSGVALVILLFINKSRFKKFTFPLLASGFIGGLIVVAGSLNKGPLASILNQESVTYRGDYWRAGWKMSIDHPFFGVGLDSYGDWYRRTRTLEATIRRGPEIVSNAAHNVLLDFSSSGGFPLAIIYVVMMTLVVRAAVRVIRRDSSLDRKSVV